MRYFSPDFSNLTDSGHRSASTIPTGMDTDPNADEEVINQQTDNALPQDDYPKPVEKSSESAKIVPDNLADSIAYALDGSGPGPTNDTPNVSGHKVITEGITGAGLEDEEDALRA